MLKFIDHGKPERECSATTCPEKGAPTEEELREECRALDLLEALEDEAASDDQIL